MNRINIFLLGMAVSLSAAISACGDGTEVLTPSEPEKNYFETDPSDNSLAATLRRDFYKETGIYLLYDDLLRTYSDGAGVEQEERIDFGWGFTTNNSYLDYTMDELSEEEKSEVTQLFVKYFVPYINVKDGTLRPYSILLTKNLISNVEYYGAYEPTDYLSNWRCFCVNTSEWIGADEATAKALGRSLLKSLVVSKVKYTDPEVDPFLEVCQDCYDAYYIYEIIPEWEYEQNIEWVYELGFMKYYPDSYGDPTYDSFSLERRDLESFMDALFDQSEDEFLEQWGDYPKIVQKYNILKDVISKLGVDFNAVK